MATNIKTVITYALDGSKTDFTIPFEYLARKFVVVTLIGVDRRELVLTTDYRFATKTVISTTTAWGAAQGYTSIEIRRFTSATERLVGFTDGSILRAYDLNVAQLQTIHVAEEARDSMIDTIGSNINGDLDARSRKIVNLAEPVIGNDASTKNYVDSVYADLVNTIGTSINTIKNGLYGYITKRSFSLGSTLSNPNEVLFSETDGEFYRWDGELPKVVPSGSTPESTGGVANGSWKSVGDATLRGDLLKTTGASNVITRSGKTVQTSLEDLGSYAAYGAPNKYTQQLRARRKLSAVDFGTPSEDIGASANNVMSSLAEEYSPSATVSIRGGDFELPRGSYPTLTAIKVEKHPSGVSSLTIRGQGQQTTELNLTGATGSISGITGGTGGPTFGVIRDFAIKGSPNKAVNLVKYSRMTFKNLHASNSGSDGYFFGNGFVTIMEKLTAKDNASFGVHFDAAVQHTSHHVSGGFASYNGASGWYWGHMNYSVATAVASDENKQYGHVIERGNAFVFNGCGAESNGRSAFAVLSSAARGETKNTIINGAYAHINGQDGTGYPNLLYVLAQDGVASQVRIAKSHSFPRAGDTTPDIIVDGIGSEVEIDDCTLPNGWRSQNGGYVHWIPKTLLVRSLAVAESTMVPICNLKSTQGHSRFSGTLTIVAGNNSPDVAERNTAIYHLLVSKSILKGYQVILMASAGHTTGGSASSPAFTFSIEDDKLMATPVGSASGSFWFEIDSASQVVATKL